MKLIDLLVKELPKRGGWPEGANYAVQDADGAVKFAKTLTYLHYLAGEWRSNENGYDWIYGDRPFDGNFVTEWTADDNHGAVISMARYEREISNNKTGKQPSNEWNGEGLPPVGMQCEIVDPDGVLMYGQGESGEVIAHVENTAVIRMSYGLGCFEARFLRHASSEADKKREVAAQALCDSCGGNGKVDEKLGFGIMWFGIYDAIAAGKIPGVKLDD